MWIRRVLAIVLAGAAVLALTLWLEGGPGASKCTPRTCAVKGEVWQR